MSGMAGEPVSAAGGKLLETGVVFTCLLPIGLKPFNGEFSFDMLSSLVQVLLAFKSSVHIIRKRQVFVSGEWFWKKTKKPLEQRYIRWNS